MEEIYLLCHLTKHYRRDQQDLDMVFIDLEQACDRVPQEILWKALEKKGAHTYI